MTGIEPIARFCRLECRYATQGVVYERGQGTMRKLMLLVVAATASAVCAAPSSAQVPGRDADPVVLKGSALPALAGAAPANVVAFRWTGSAWDQIPVQVDERAAVAFNRIYNFQTCNPFACNFTGTSD